MCVLRTAGNVHHGPMTISAESCSVASRSPTPFVHILLLSTQYLPFPSEMCVFYSILCAGPAFPISFLLLALSLSRTQMPMPERSPPGNKSMNIYTNTPAPATAHTPTCSVRAFFLSLSLSLFCWLSSWIFRKKVFHSFTTAGGSHVMEAYCYCRRQSNVVLKCVAPDGGGNIRAKVDYQLVNRPQMAFSLRI